MAMALDQEQAEEASAFTPDWQREHLNFLEWNPGKRLLACIRDYQQWRQAGPWFRLLLWWPIVRHRFWSALTGADIPLNCNICGGLLIPHPNGVVIHPQARVGPNCLIFQQVTLGTLQTGGTPVIGGHVDVGAGAKILGPITIGEHAVIGANAVVLVDVPPWHVAIGVPAQVIPRKKEGFRP